MTPNTDQVGGERVLFEGTPYQAKWWNQGDSPAMATVDPDSSPWIPLSQTQILEIMKRQGLCRGLCS